MRPVVPLLLCGLLGSVTCCGADDTTSDSRPTSDPHLVISIGPPQPAPADRHLPCLSRGNPYLRAVTLDYDDQSATLTFTIRPALAALDHWSGDAYLDVGRRESYTFTVYVRAGQPPRARLQTDGEIGNRPVAATSAAGSFQLTVPTDVADALRRADVVQLDGAVTAGRHYECRGAVF